MKQDDPLFEIRVRVPREHLDLACDFVVERICSGMVLEEEAESSEATIIVYASPLDVKGHVASIRGYLTNIIGTSDDSYERVTSREIANVSWEEEYRRSVRPVVIGEDVVVRPPWASSPIATAYDIIIEPKMAFGTGTHETTRSCLEIIREKLRRGDRFLDLGCGSGILSILAGKLGASHIKAIDYDQVAVENCLENFKLNAVTASCEAMLGSIEQCREDAPYQFIAANIIKSTIVEMLPRLVELTAHPGTLVLSGLLDQDLPEIYAGLDTLGAGTRTTLADGEWRTITISFH